MSAAREDEPLILLYTQLRLLGFSSCALKQHEFGTVITGPRGFISWKDGAFRPTVVKTMLISGRQTHTLCDPVSPEDEVAVMAMVVNVGIAKLPDINL